MRYRGEINIGYARFQWETVRKKNKDTIEVFAVTPEENPPSAKTVWERKRIESAPCARGNRRQCESHARLIIEGSKAAQTHISKMKKLWEEGEKKREELAEKVEVKPDPKPEQEEPRTHEVDEKNTKAKSEGEKPENFEDESEKKPDESEE